MRTFDPLAAPGDPDRTSMTVSYNLTATRGSRTVVESGGFTSVHTVPQNPSDPSESELIGDRLTLSFSIDGKLRDQFTLSSFDIDAFDRSAPTQQRVEHFSYDVDSSRLRGHIGVMTTQDIEVGSAIFPSAGQVLISGANHTRLQMTILGDESFTPPAGQGQIALQIDPGTGAFGAPIWTSWGMLSVLAMIGP